MVSKTDNLGLHSHLVVEQSVTGDEVMFNNIVRFHSSVIFGNVGITY